MRMSSLHGVPIAFELRAKPKSKKAKYECATLTVTYAMRGDNCPSQKDAEDVAYAYTFRVMYCLKCAACVSKVNADDRCGTCHSIVLKLAASSACGLHVYLGHKLPETGCGLPGHTGAASDEGTGYCLTCAAEAREEA